MNTLFRLVAVRPSDSDLHGLWAENPGREGVAVHIHGTWGNFYGNPFIVKTADLYTSSPLGGFLTANFPGHDETAVFERWEDFTPALDLWLENVAPTGPVLLQGHSLGALKAIHYMVDPRAANVHRIVGLVLLSPFDSPAFYCGGNLERMEGNLERVREMHEREGPRAIIPPDIFDMWQISVGTYLELAAPRSPGDLFPARNQLKTSPILQLGVPMFIAIGGEDFAAFPSPQAEHELVSRVTNAHSVLIPAGPHNFAGTEDRLIAELSVWVRTLGKRGS